jgi:hypothetical protein
MSTSTSTVTVDGREYVRVYVCELEAGDVTAFGETVESVDRVSDHRTVVRFTNGEVTAYGNGHTTALIEC